MTSAPFFLSADYLPAIDTAANVLRTYALKKQIELPGAGAISIDPLGSAISKAAENFWYANFHAGHHHDQIRASYAKKQIGPILTVLKDLRRRLEKIGDDRWRDWTWAASEIYADMEDVRGELSKRNSKLSEHLEGGDEEAAKYIETPIDIVGADLSDLSAIVNRVERRLQKVNSSLPGGSIPTTPSAFHGFVADLRPIRNVGALGTLVVLLASKIE